jgi:hypothetical protein
MAETFSSHELGQHVLPMIVEHLPITKQAHIDYAEHNSTQRNTHYLSSVQIYKISGNVCWCDRLCGLVVRVPGCRSRGLGSIPSTTRFSEKLWVWIGVHSAS